MWLRPTADMALYWPSYIGKLDLTINYIASKDRKLQLCTIFDGSRLDKGRGVLHGVVDMGKKNVGQGRGVQVSVFDLFFPVHRPGSWDAKTLLS